MPQSISGSIKLTLKHSYVNVLDFNEVVDNLNKVVEKTFVNGTGANAAQHVWHDKRTLTSNGDDDLELTALVNAFGTVNFNKIRAIAVNVITATSGYQLKLGGATANPWSAFVNDASDVVKIPGGGVFLWSATQEGAAIANNNKILRINNPSAGAVEYEIWILGNGTLQ